MVIQHNMTAANANRNLGVTTGQLAKSTEKLSSGYKINRAGDNAAGLAISEKMRGQIRGLDQASTNAEDGISMIQTAEGALTETHSILQRMRELAVQASSDTNTDDDRTQIQNEIDQLTEEVDRIANTTEFNTQKLLDGSKKGSVSAKDGSSTVEGSFSNSNVSASISGDTEKTSFTDAIRIEITKDFDTVGSAGKLSATAKDVDDYAKLVKDNADTLNAVKSLASGSTKVTFDDDDIKAYTDAVTVALKNDQGGGLDAAVTTAWNTIAGKIAAPNDLVGTVTVGGTDLTNASDETTTEAAVKKALDDYAKNAVKLDTNTAYSELSKAKVKDLAGAETDLKTLVSSEIDATKDFNNDILAVGTAGLTATGVDALAKSYKDAYKVAKASGMSDTDAEQADAVVAARTKLYDAFDADLKNITDTASEAELSDGNDIADTDKKSVAAGKAFDSLVASAKDVAVAELEKENALTQLKAMASDEKPYTVTDLFGNGTNGNMSISSQLNSSNELTITLKNDDNSTSTITIANANKLKAGDTVTITSKKKVDTEPAKSGKDAFRLQIGANAGQEVALGINSMKSKDLNIVQTKPGVEGKALDVTNQKSASLAIEAYDMAIQSVSTERAKMGAMQNRLEHTISNLDTSSENLQAAESSLRDTDMAEEMTKYSKNNILMQAGQSMLAQANQATQGVLSLLG